MGPQGQISGSGAPSGARSAVRSGEGDCGGSGRGCFSVKPPGPPPPPPHTHKIRLQREVLKRLSQDLRFPAASSRLLCQAENLSLVGEASHPASLFLSIPPHPPPSLGLLEGSTLRPASPSPPLPQVSSAPRCPPHARCPNLSPRPPPPPPAPPPPRPRVPPQGPHPQQAQRSPRREGRPSMAGRRRSRSARPRVRRRNGATGPTRVTGVPSRCQCTSTDRCWLGCGRLPDAPRPHHTRHHTNHAEGPLGPGAGVRPPTQKAQRPMV